MKMLNATLAGMGLALFFVVPVLATPAQDLERLYQEFKDGAYPRAHSEALAYLAANGPRYSAAFVAAASACKLHPHRGTNRQPFDQLRVDYFVSDTASLEIQNWIRLCTSAAPPPPPPRTDGIGVSTSALSVDPASSSAKPARNEPAPKRPRVPATPLVRNPPAVSFGPMTSPGLSDRCVQGFVWRAAFAGDNVCVTPATRSEVAADNAAAASRIDPAGAYGPNTCVSGYVWREARPSDQVCVVPARRSAAAQDNAQAGARRAR